MLQLSSTLLNTLYKVGTKKKIHKKRVNLYGIFVKMSIGFTASWSFVFTTSRPVIIIMEKFNAIKNHVRKN